MLSFKGQVKAKNAKHMSSRLSKYDKLQYEQSKEALEKVRLHEYKNDQVKFKSAK